MKKTLTVVTTFFVVAMAIADLDYSSNAVFTLGNSEDLTVNIANGDYIGNRDFSYHKYHWELGLRGAQIAMSIAEGHPFTTEGLATVDVINSYTRNTGQNAIFFEALTTKGELNLDAMGLNALEPEIYNIKSDNNKSGIKLNISVVSALPVGAVNQPLSAIIISVLLGLALGTAYLKRKQIRKKF